MRCLYCYKPLEKAETDFHPACSKKFFGYAEVPVLPYGEDAIEKLALQAVRVRATVPGVQKKLSLDLELSGKNEPRRFTIVGLWGGYIVKSPTPHYPQLPEVEDLTMHLAELARIKVVPHSLIRMQSGNLAYITRRIDRAKKRKLHMEDMCQLTEKLTEDKYRGSYEQVARAIAKYSAYPGLDIVNFYEVVLFSFITGNADMHLKNFSLINQAKRGWVLSPAYDLVATSLVHPSDDEELALTLNAKKKKITRKDFVTAFETSKLGKKQYENLFEKILSAKQKWFDFIDISMISQDFKLAYKNLINERIARIS